MGELRIFSQRLVTPDAAFSGEVILSGEKILAVEPRDGPSARAIDWDADDLIPGIVDIHTDNLEKHFMPRPGAAWDAIGAALAHDAQCAGAGVTTVFDSMGFWGRGSLDRQAAFAGMIAGVDEAARAGVLRSEHFLHLRCQAAVPDLMGLMTPHLDNPRLKLLSIMDRRHEAAELARRLAAARAEGREHSALAEKAARMAEGADLPEADEQRRLVAATAKRLGLALASHDDCSAADVDKGHAEGATIGEFPMTMVAAQRSRALGQVVAMGGPNFVRGGSHTDNLSARDAAANELLDVLCSDYVPLSMLRAAYLLSEGPLAWPLPRAIATVSLNAARCAKLFDRGALEPGQRADLVRVARGPQGWPIPRETWARGVRVA